MDGCTNETTPLRSSAEEQKRPCRSWCETPTLRGLWFTAAGFAGFALAELFGSIVAESLSMRTDAISMLIDSSTYVINIMAELRPDPAVRSGAVLWSTMALLGCNIYVTLSAVSRRDPPATPPSLEHACSLTTPCLVPRQRPPTGQPRQAPWCPVVKRDWFQPWFQRQRDRPESIPSPVTPYGSHRWIGS